MIDPKVERLVKRYAATVKQLNEIYIAMQAEGIYIYQEFKRNSSVGGSDSPNQLVVKEIKQSVDYKIPTNLTIDEEETV